MFLSTKLFERELKSNFTAFAKKKSCKTLQDMPSQQLGSSYMFAFSSIWPSSLKDPDHQTSAMIALFPKHFFILFFFSCTRSCAEEHATLTLFDMSDDFHIEQRPRSPC